MSMSESKAAARPLAMVTGASEGLGRAIAVRLAIDGFDLVICDLPGLALEATGALVEEAATSAKVYCQSMDVRSEQQIDTAFSSVERDARAITVLVNNAGVTTRGPMVDVDPAGWNKIMDVNAKGSYFVTQRFARTCLASGLKGSVVMLASTFGLVGRANRSLYGISKGSIVHMTRMLAAEWATSGIRVNGVAPATIETPSRAAILQDPSTRATLLAAIPMGRFGTEAEVAEAVCFLATERSSFITGHTLPVDGGLTSV
jgi:NAD(P)-dependent dehydrogenase (short-subunit alcohol dehydrogenase family)